MYKSAEMASRDCWRGCRLAGRTRSRGERGLRRGEARAPALPPRSPTLLAWGRHAHVGVRNAAARHWEHPRVAVSLGQGGDGESPPRCLMGLLPCRSTVPGKQRGGRPGLRALLLGDSPVLHRGVRGGSPLCPSFPRTTLAGLPPGGLGGRARREAAFAPY